MLAQLLEAVLNELLFGARGETFGRSTLLELSADLLRIEEQLLELAEREEELRGVAAFAFVVIIAALVPMVGHVLGETLVAAD